MGLTKSRPKLEVGFIIDGEVGQESIDNYTPIWVSLNGRTKFQGVTPIFELYIYIYIFSSRDIQNNKKSEAMELNNNKIHAPFKV